jgi:hypothetical protein
MKGSRFLNQKLGKRVDRKARLLKARLEAQRRPPRPVPPSAALAKKAPSR